MEAFNTRSLRACAPGASVVPIILATSLMPSQSTSEDWRVVGPRQRRFSERPQRGGQISAVHGGDESRFQHRQILGVVPVQPVTAAARHPQHRLERLPRFDDELRKREIAEVDRGNPRIQQEPQIRRGHPVRLPVATPDEIGDQPIELWRAEGPEEAPCAQRVLTHEEDVPWREVSGSRFPGVIQPSRHCAR